MRFFYPEFALRVKTLIEDKENCQDVEAIRVQYQIPRLFGLSNSPFAIA